MYRVLKVSTADVVSYLEVRKKRDKIPLFAWEREVSFFFSYWGFREFKGLINQDMLQL